jgi:hypothetical protein
MKKVTFNNFYFIQLLFFAFLLITGFSHSVFAIAKPMIFPIRQSVQITNNDFILAESVNPRFGKIIKEVNMYGSVNYQSTQPVRNPKTKPIKSNAVFFCSF